MYTVAQTEEFGAWLAGLRDRTTRLRLVARLAKVRNGNLGDHAAIGEGVWELREFFGPGWRMYYVHQGSAIILMLGGGDKSTQQRDIERAKEMAMELRNEQDDQDQNPSV